MFFAVPPEIWPMLIVVNGGIEGGVGLFLELARELLDALDETRGARNRGDAEGREGAVCFASGARSLPRAHSLCRRGSAAGRSVHRRSQNAARSRAPREDASRPMQPISSSAVRTNETLSASAPRSAVMAAARKPFVSQLPRPRTLSPSTSAESFSSKGTVSVWQTRASGAVAGAEDAVHLLDSVAGRDR